MMTSWPTPPMRRTRTTAAPSQVKETPSSQRRARWEAITVRFMTLVPGSASWNHLTGFVLCKVSEITFFSSVRWGRTFLPFDTLLTLFLLMTSCVSATCCSQYVWTTQWFIILHCNSEPVFFHLLLDAEWTKEEQDSPHCHRNYELWECVRVLICFFLKVEVHSND